MTGRCRKDGTKRMHNACLVGRSNKEQRARARQILLLLHVLGLKECTLPGPDLSHMREISQAAKRQESITTPFFLLVDCIAEKQNKLSIILVEGDTEHIFGYRSLMRSGTEKAALLPAQTNFPSATTNCAHLARFEERFTQHLSCALCWVRSCIPAIFFLCHLEDSFLFLPLTRLLISCFSTCNRPANPCLARSYQSYATICGRDIAYRSVPAEGGSILETAASSISASF
jgi:hypothetical protein